MANVKFNRLTKSGKSALVLVKKSILEFNADPCYIPIEAAKHYLNCEPSEMEKGMAFEIPDGFSLVNMTDENGEPRTTKDGSANLKQLSYS